MRKENKFVYFGNNITVIVSDKVLIRADIPVSLQEISTYLRKECDFPTPAHTEIPRYEKNELHVGNTNVARKSRFFSITFDDASAIAWAFAN